MFGSERDSVDLNSYPVSDMWTLLLEGLRAMRDSLLDASAQQELLRTKYDNELQAQRVFMSNEVQKKKESLRAQIDRGKGNISQRQSGRK